MEGKYSTECIPFMNYIRNEWKLHNEDGIRKGLVILCLFLALNYPEKVFDRSNVLI